MLNFLISISLMAALTGAFLAFSTVMLNFGLAFTLSAFLLFSGRAFARESIYIDAHPSTWTRTARQLDAQAEKQVRIKARDYFTQSLSDILTRLEKSGKVGTIGFNGVRDKAYPSRFNPSLQQKIDRGFELIMATPSGRQWMKDASLNTSLDPKDRVNADVLNPEALQNLVDWQSVNDSLRYLWGISRGAADEITFGRDPHPCQKDSNEEFWSIGGDRISRKDYFFALGASHNEIESYSGGWNHNVTGVWLGDTADPDIELLHVLVHEMSVTSDMKWNLNRWLSDVAPRELQHRWSKASQDRGFNQLFAIMRAYRMEARIFQDLNRIDPKRFKLDAPITDFIHLTPGSCHRIYERLTRGSFLNAEGATRTDRERLRSYLPEGATLRIGDNTVDACLTLSEPAPKFFTLTRGGPRPRGGGW